MRTLFLQWWLPVIPRHIRTTIVACINFVNIISRSGLFIGAIINNRVVYINSADFVEKTSPDNEEVVLIRVIIFLHLNVYRVRWQRSKSNWSNRVICKINKVLFLRPLWNTTIIKRKLTRQHARQRREAKNRQRDAKCHLDLFAC